jgi:hypothetical protein
VRSNSDSGNEVRLVTAIRSLRDGAPVAAHHPAAALSSLPTGTPPPPVAPALHPAVSVSTEAVPFSRRERVVLTAGTVVGAFILHVADGFGVRRRRTFPL